MDHTNVDHVVVFCGADDQYRWRAVAANGEIVSEGESHTREANAARAARGVFGDEMTLLREKPDTDDSETADPPEGADA